MQLLALFLIVTVTAAHYVPFDPQLDEYWENFKKLFRKHYNGREEVARRMIWEENVAEVVRHNLRADMGMHTYMKGINEYSDMNHSEFVKHFNGFRHNGLKSNNGSTWLEPRNIRVPDKIDWRDEGLVTPIKNQLKCGSCWSFSTTGSLEGQYMKKTGKLVSLSEQNLVDCSSSYGNNGCNGGLMDHAYRYIKDNSGIDTEESYPYTGLDLGKCYFSRANVGATCSGYVDLPSGEEDALLKAVATIGPISVAIDARNPSFQLYKSGIYDELRCSGESEQLDHAVLVVGYGSEDGHDYWIVKNSWGLTWGEHGYIKMSRNKGNQCGIATLASYPLV